MDLATWQLALPELLPPHHLEAVADTPPADIDLAVLPAGEQEFSMHCVHHLHVPRTVAAQPVSYVDACINDLLGLAQGDEWRRMRVTHATLHALDHVFSPTQAS